MYLFSDYLSKMIKKAHLTFEDQSLINDLKTDNTYNVKSALYALV